MVLNDKKRRFDDIFSEPILSVLRKKETNSVKRPKQNKVLYNVKSQIMLSNIFELKPKIQLYHINEENEKIIYEGIYTGFLEDYHFFHGQHVYEDDDGNEQLYTFEYTGRNINNKKIDNSEDYLHNSYKHIDDSDLKNIFVNKEKSKLYYFDQKNENIKRILDMYNVKLIFDEKEINEFSDKIKEEVENMKSLSEQYGSGNKYIKYLKNKSIQKLQQIAKNKNIEYVKKYKGKIIEIKRETLEKKLLKKYLESR